MERYMRLPTSSRYGYLLLSESVNWWRLWLGSLGTHTESQFSLHTNGFILSFFDYKSKKTAKIHGFHLKMILEKIYHKFDTSFIVADNKNNINVYCQDVKLLVFETCEDERIRFTWCETKNFNEMFELFVPASRCLFKSIQALSQFTNFVCTIMETNCLFHVYNFIKFSVKKCCFYVEL